MLAKSLNIKENTARKIIYRSKSGQSSQSHGGHKKKKITDEIGEKLLDFVADNKTATIEEMKRYLRVEFPALSLSNTCISDYLDGQLITYKKVRLCPVQRNSDRVKGLRADYARWHIESGVNSEIIFIDEVGVNVWTKRSYGRSKAGERLYQVVNRIRGENITVCTAISKSGMLHYKTKLGGFKGEDYRSFFGELVELLMVDQTRNFSLVMDNASIHYGLDSTPNAIEVVYLPPYSPFLNPIEAFFSVFKSNLKTLLANVSGVISYQERKRKVLEFIPRAMEIDQHTVEKFYRHSSSFNAKCISQENIMGD